MNTLCACGCGKDLPPRSKKNPNRMAHFIQGHWSRTGDFRTMKEGGRIQPPPDWSIPSGTCECGCGEKTQIAQITNRRNGHYAGFPLRFIHGHNNVGLPPEKTSRWKGGRWTGQDGYVMIHVGTNEYRGEHVLVWEKAYGLVPKGHCVHHKNGKRADNRLENLDCLSRSTHKELHQGEEGTYHQRLSDDEMIAAYRKLWLRLGRPPATTECKPANGTPTWHTYADRFGTVDRLRQLAYS